MATKISNFTVGSTGNKSITGLTFLPTELDFWIAQKTGTTESFAHLSVGATNGTSQTAHSMLQDTTGGKTESYFDRCVYHLNRVSGTVSGVLSASFVSFDNNGGGDYGFTLNFTAADSGYKVYFRARS